MKHQQMIFIIIMLTSEEYTLYVCVSWQNDTKIDTKIISAEELVVKAKYLWYMQESTNWFWDQHPQQQVFTVHTCTILYSRPDVIAIKIFMTYPKVYVTEHKQKNPYQDILFVWLILTTIISKKRLIVETKLSLKYM